MGKCFAEHTHFFSLQHAVEKTNILVWHRLDARPAISYSVTFSIRKLKRKKQLFLPSWSMFCKRLICKWNVASSCLHFLFENFCKISAWSLRYCRNLTFWKYSAEYWLNLICSRPNLCACVQCAVQPQGSFDILDIFTELLSIRPILSFQFLKRPVRRKIWTWSRFYFIQKYKLKKNRNHHPTNSKIFHH